MQQRIFISIVLVSLWFGSGFTQHVDTSFGADLNKALAERYSNWIFEHHGYIYVSFEDSRKTLKRRSALTTLEIQKFDKNGKRIKEFGKRGKVKVKWRFKNMKSYVWKPICIVNNRICVRYSDPEKLFRLSIFDLNGEHLYDIENDSLGFGSQVIGITSSDSVFVRYDGKIRKFSKFNSIDLNFGIYGSIETLESDEYKFDGRLLLIYRKEFGECSSYVQPLSMDDYSEPAGPKNFQKDNYIRSLKVFEYNADGSLIHVSQLDTVPSNSTKYFCRHKTTGDAYLYQQEQDLVLVKNYNNVVREFEVKSSYRSSYLNNAEIELLDVVDKKASIYISIACKRIEDKLQLQQKLAWVDQSGMVVKEFSLNDIRINDYWYNIKDRSLYIYSKDNYVVDKENSALDNDLNISLPQKVIKIDLSD